MFLPLLGKQVTGYKKRKILSLNEILEILVLFLGSGLSCILSNVTNKTSVFDFPLLHFILYCSSRKCQYDENKGDFFLALIIQRNEQGFNSKMISEDSPAGFGILILRKIRRPMCTIRSTICMNIQSLSL